MRIDISEIKSIINDMNESISDWKSMLTVPPICSGSGTGMESIKNIVSAYMEYYKSIIELAEATVDTLDRIAQEFTAADSIKLILEIGEK